MVSVLGILSDMDTISILSNNLKSSDIFESSRITIIIVQLLKDRNQFHLESSSSLSSLRS
jgi:hypothetical protein